MKRTIMLLAALAALLTSTMALAWNYDTYGDTRVAWKMPVAAVCTSNMDLAGNETCDGVTVTAGVHVVLVGQTAGAENGIYVAGTAWRRRSDADEAAELAAGVKVYVSGGTLYAGATYVLTTTGTITVGTTSQAWSAEVAGVTSQIGVETEKYPVEAVCTSNMDLAGNETCDGSALVAGDYALLVGQTAAAENGIYTVGTAWARRADANATGELVAGVRVYAQAGTLYAASSWVLTTTGTITVGTTAQTWVVAAYPTDSLRTGSHAPVAAVCTSNMDLDGAETCDGVASGTGHLLLVGQTAGAENGIYTAGAAAWTRRADADATGELAAGAKVYVAGGTLYAGATYVLTTTGTITIDTTSNAWAAEIAGVTSMIGVATEKYPVEGVCTSNMDLAGNETCGGATITSGDYVLVAAQNAPAGNGIYVASAGGWSKRADANATGELVTGTHVYVTSGDYAGSVWTLTTEGVITINTTAQTWALATFVDGEISIPLAAGHADGGTWTYAVTSGALETATRTAADAADSFWAPIPVVNRTGALKGVMPTGATVTYTVTTADCADLRAEVWKCTQQVTGTPISCAVVYGESDDDYADAYDTAAERCDDTAAPGVHTVEITDAGTPAHLGAGEFLQLRVYVDGDAGPASIVAVTSASLLYTGMFADR